MPRWLVLTARGRPQQRRTANPASRRPGIWSTNRVAFSRGFMGFRPSPCVLSHPQASKMGGRRQDVAQDHVGGGENPIVWSYFASPLSTVIINTEDTVMQRRVEVKGRSVKRHQRWTPCSMLVFVTAIDLTDRVTCKRAY